MNDIVMNREAENVTIGACLSDLDAIVFVAPIVSPGDFCVPAHRWMAEAIWWCFNNRTPPTMSAVIDRLIATKRWTDNGNGSRDAVSMADIDAALAATSITDIEYAPQNAMLIRDASFRRAGRIALERASKLFSDQTLPADDIQRAVLKTVGEVFDGRAQRDAAVSSIADIEHQRIASMSDTELPGVTCGIKWLDDLTGGFAPAESWVIAAPYKMRKTTLALNMILSSARSGAPVSVFTVGDSTRDATYRKLLALEINRTMLARRVGEDKHVVSSKTLQYKLRDPFYEELKNVADTELTKLPIRLYDGRDLISDLRETARILRRDHAMYGTRIFVYDYAQACSNGKDDYEKTMNIAGWTQQVSGELGITAIVISQLNENAVRTNDGSEYSPGAKGGGSLPAMANVFLTVAYQEPTVTITLKLARDVRMNDKVSHRINPASGILLDGKNKVNLNV